MDIFIQECLQRHDLTASLAAGIVYGSWPIQRPQVKTPSKFQFADYKRYSEASRQEIIKALVEENNRSLLKDIFLGWVEDPQFLKELDLWKQWGVKEQFIYDTIDDYLNLKMASYNWFNTTAFSSLMKYIDKKLTRLEAAEWINSLKRRTTSSSPVYLLFTEIIDKHTIH